VQVVTLNFNSIAQMSCNWSAKRPGWHSALFVRSESESAAW